MLEVHGNVVGSGDVWSVKAFICRYMRCSGITAFKGFRKVRDEGAARLLQELSHNL